MARRAVVVIVAGVLTALAAAPAQAINKNESVGLFQPAGGWQLIDRLAGGNSADYNFAFGATGDVPVSGDWDGDGVDGPGLFRNGNWFLINRAPASGTPNGDLSVWGFGMAGDKPFAGDFNGDGKDDIGVFRVWNGGANSGWFIHLSPVNGQTNPPSDITVANWGGSPEDTPVTGDWDADGRDGIGFFRNGTWYLLNTPANGQTNPPPSIVTYFGDTGDQPIAGDWDGDSKDTFGVFRASENGTWYLTNETTGYLPNDITFSYWGGPSDKPIAGDWDGRKPQCRDGVDNDHDGYLDWSGGDVGCANAYDTPEDVVQPVTPTNQVQVWDFNTAGMATDPAGPTDPTKSDYRKFVRYITNPSRVTYRPDIVVLQEAGTNLTDGSKLPDGTTTKPSCHVFEAALEARTPSDYYCVETTYRGGAAVLWRIDPVGGTGSPGRFSREQTSAITTGKKVPLYVGPTGACAVPTNPTSGDWWAMALRLKDNAVSSSPKYVNIASMHLKTGGDDCAWQNMKLLNSELAVGPANMQIMAGDTNHADAAATNTHDTYGGWECWYTGMNASLGMCEGGIANFNWRDVMYQKWIAGTSEADRYGLTHAYEWSWSHHWPDPPTDHDRRDFIFTRTYSIANDPNQPNQQPRTVPWEDAGGTQPRYSDHRGLGALLRYCAGSTLSGCSSGGA